MPDLAVGPPTGLYPQPPAQQGALSGNPMQMLDLIGGIQRNEQMRREMAGRAGVGRALQGATTPDGIDPLKARSGLMSDPDIAASGMLPAALEHIQGIFKAQSETGLMQTQAANSILSSLPLKGTTDEQLRHFSATAVRAGLPPAMVEAQRDALMKLRGKARDDAIAVLRANALGPAGTSQLVEAPPGPGGEPQKETLGERLQRGAGGGPQAVGVGLGAPESSALMQHDLARARGFGQEMLPWNEALSAVNDFEAKGGKFGPGAEARQDVQAFVQALSPKLASALGIDPKELADFAKAKKYLAQGLQTRAAGFGTGTADHLATTAAGTPNVHVTDLALPDLIKMNMAARRAEQAQTMDARKAGPMGYSDAAGSWSSKNDIRAFALDQLSPEARTKLLGSLKKGTPEYTRFNNSLRSAYEHGLMTPPGKTSEQPHPAATKAPDGNWYLPDPKRPGKVMKVTPAMLPQLGG